MPRSGPLGTYTLPGAQKTQQPNTVIQSAVNNQGYADIEQTFNTPTPLSYGGTGASTAGGAADALSPAYVNVASGATTNIGAATSPNVNVTGTATVTAFDNVAAGITRYVRASGAFTLTHSAALLLPANGANITTAANDTFTAKSLGSGDWIVTDYQRASGQPLIAPANLATKVDVRRNRIVNGDMRVAGPNGSTAGTTNGYFATADWATYFVSSAATITSQQVSSWSPAGSPNRYRVTITAADASLAAGEFLTITQNLKGANVADFRYGSADAKPSVHRFGFKGPAGTYAAALHNAAVNRSYVALFTITAGQANTDTIQSIALPGDTTGTWLTGEGDIGITLDVVLAAGSTFRGATGWQAGNMLATSAISNGMGTTGAVFELFDVGLRLDPDGTAMYGQYEVADPSPRAGAVKLLSGTVTAGASTLDVPLTAGFKSISIKLTDLIPSTNDVSLRMRTSSDGGASFNSGASDYHFASRDEYSTGSGTTPQSGGAAFINVAGGGGNSVGVSSEAFAGVSATIEIPAFENPSTRQKVQFDAIAYVPSARVARTTGAGLRNAAGKIDAVRFYFSTGNIASGSYEVYGYV